jgi:uncharacterized protein YbcI
MAPPTQVESLTAHISRRAVQHLAEYTGRGSTHAHTVINHDSVMVLLGDVLTKGEHRLVEEGQADHVLETRRRYQRAMRDDLVSMVEDAVGRKVVAFMSDNHLNPDLAVEIFVLEPAGGEDGHHVAASTQNGPAVEGTAASRFPVDGPIQAAGQEQRK